MQRRRTGKPSPESPVLLVYSHVAGQTVHGPGALRAPPPHTHTQFHNRCCILACWNHRCWGKHGATDEHRSSQGIPRGPRTIPLYWLNYPLSLIAPGKRPVWKSLPSFCLEFTWLFILNRKRAENKTIFRSEASWRACPFYSRVLGSAREVAAEVGAASHPLVCKE